MVESITIGDPDSGPEAPQDEAVVQEQESIQPNEEEEASDRPEWLPPKFESPEDLAKAYGSLEKKLSQKDATEKGLLTSDEFENYYDEYNSKGELSEDTYDTLSKRGISKDLVDQYIQGQESLNEKQVADMHSLVGGEDAYKGMTEWAAENISEEELEAFNTAVSSGESATIKLAIRGVYSQFREAGNAPTLVQGGKTPAIGGYGSTQEMSKDMSDPRYTAGDKNWHAHVEKRLAASGNII